MQRWTLPALTRASSVLFGMAMVAAVCWAVTGSASALGSAFIGGGFAAALSWLWHGLTAMAHDLAARH